MEDAAEKSPMAEETQPEACADNREAAPPADASAADAEATAACAPQPAETTGILEKLSAIEQGLSTVTELAETLSVKLDHNSHREELLTKLHAENQEHKSGLYKKLIMPLVNEIIFVMDSYTQLRKGYAAMEVSSIDVGKLLKQFGEIADDLEDVLYKNGIEVYEASQVGEPVDCVKQKIAKTVPTDDPQKHQTVCERLKKGFVLEEKIIRQEQVSCYKYDSNLTAK